MKKPYVKTMVLFIILSLLSLSCKKDEIVKKNIVKPNTENDFVLKHSFGVALSKAIVNNPSVRVFLKREALKMFDEDYDVLYQFIKDQTLENGKTFRNILLEYFNKEEELATIEATYPLLTIW